MSELPQSGAPRGRQLRATHAFAGAVAEMAATSPLDPGEDVLLHGAVRLRGVGVLPRPAVVRLTAPRLVVLGHYALQPDRVWEIPVGSVVAAELDGARLPVTWRDTSGEVRELCLSAWTGRPALDAPLRDMAALAELLTDWGRGAGSGPRAS